MGCHYILDGYNVLHSDRRWSDLPREKKRLEFLHTVELSPITGSARNTVTVVLDGYAASLKDLRLKAVRLIFSGDRDADTVIKEMVTELGNPKDAVVVTNDRGIHAVVRRAGAKVISCEEFFSLQKKNVISRPNVKVDPLSADSINKELKQIWKLD